MSQYISECPNCHTTFNISDEQLNVADGMVRCGKCMHIYNARDKIAEAATEPTLPINSDGDDNWLIDDNFSLDGEDNIEEQVTTSTKPLIDSEAPLYDTDEWESKPFEPSSSASLNDDILNFDESSLADDALFKDLEELEKSQQSSEDWAEDLLKEDDENSPENAAFEDILSQLDTNFKNDDEVVSPQTAAGSTSALFDNADRLDTITTRGTRQQFHFKKERHWQKRVLIIGSLLLIASLIGQYTVYNFNSLSSNPNSRPLLAAVCQQGLCQLPEQRSIQQIKTTNLVVRNHPSEPQSLKIDLIVSNHANFEQRFPQLTLQFRNLEGKIIAGRTFPPSSYLAGELAHKQLMPINQPIHIEMEIIDPGDDAVNYEIIVSD